MKKLFLILFLVVGYFANGQILQEPNVYGYKFKRVGSDSLHFIPRDTMQVPTRYNGLSFIANKGGALYYWNGTKWASFSSSGSSYTFTNGLTESGGTVKSGGIISEDTKFYIDNGYNINFDLDPGAESFSITNDGSDTAFIIRDHLNIFFPNIPTSSSITGRKVLVHDTATGKVERVDPANLGLNYADSLRRVGLDVQMKKNGIWTNQFDLPDSTKLLVGTLGGFGESVDGATIHNDTLYMQMFGAEVPGLVPASPMNTTDYLRADGTWATPAGGGSASIVSLGKLDSIIKRGRVRAYGNSLTVAFNNNTGYPYSLSKYLYSEVSRSAASSYTSAYIYSLFAADAGTEYRNYGHIFALGTNDVYNNLSTARTNIFTYLQRMSDTLTVYGNTRWVVLSILTGGGQGIGTAAHDTIVAINNALQAAYPSHYVDIRSYLISKYNPSLPSDVINYVQDVVPLSLRIDSLHLNATGYRYVAYLIDSVAKNWLIDTAGSNEFITANQLAKYLNGRTDRIRAQKEVSVGNQIGLFAPDQYLQPNSMYLGFNKTTSDTTFGDNLLFGSPNTFRSATTAYRNSGIGFEIYYSITSGYANAANGWRALYGVTTGQKNYAGGAQAMQCAGGLTGSLNTTSGAESMYSLTSGWGNTNSGYGGLQLLTTGNNNTTSGRLVQATNSTGEANSTFGSFAYYNYKGSYSTGFGHYNGYNFTTGSDLATYGAYNNYSNQTGVRVASFGAYSNYSSNVATYNTSDIATFGAYSGYRNRGSNQIFIGSNCVKDTVTGSYNIAIGDNIELPDKTASSQLTIGNVIYATGGFGTGKTVGSGNVGIGTNTPSSKLSIDGDAALVAAGNKLKIATGSNASIGTGTLSSGTATISTTAVTASSLIFVQYTSCSSCGSTYIGTITNGTSFVVNSTNASDGSNFNWWVIN